MNDRTRHAIAIGLIAGAAIIGLAGLSVLLAMVAGGGLAVIALREQQKLRARFALVGSSSVLSTAHLASLANSCVTALAAWGVGAVLRLMFQAMQ